MATDMNDSDIFIFEFSDPIITSPREAAHILVKATLTSNSKKINVSIEQMPDEWKKKFKLYAEQLGFTFTSP